MAATETVHHASPLAGGGGRVIVSPFQFTTTGEDNLRIVSANSLTGVRIAVQGRRFDERGRLVPFAFDHAPNTDRSAKTQDFALGAGALVNLTVFPSAGSPVSGQTYVMIQLIRGFGGATIVLGTLLAGYVLTMPPLGWPGSPIQSSIEGPGYIRTFVGTDPAAGSEISETVPTGARWQLITLNYGFTTGVAGGSRFSRIATVVGGQVMTLFPPADDQGVSQAVGYTWGVGMTHSSVLIGDVFMQGYPSDAPMLAGSQIVTSTPGYAVGDDYNAPKLTVREWIEL